MKSFSIQMTFKTIMSKRLNDIWVQSKRIFLIMKLLEIIPILLEA